MALSMSRRKNMAKSEFAIPEKAPGPGSYPEQSKKQAAIAVDLAGMHGSPSVKRRVDAMARSKGVDVGGKPDAINMKFATREWRSKG